LTTNVDRENTVNINGKSYAIEGDVRRELASTFPQKFVIGDVNEESHPLLSSITWTDFTGGMLKETIQHTELPENINRTFFTNLNTRHRGHLFKPHAFNRQAYGSSATATDADSPVQFIAEYRPSSATTSNVYGTNGSVGVLSLTPNNTVIYHTLESSATDFHSGRVSGLGALVAPQGSRVSWTRSDTNITSWQDDSSELITHVTTWRDMLWGVNDSAELFFTPDVSGTSLEWTKVASAEVNGLGQQRGLLVGPDDKLYLNTRRGLHKYDNERERFDNVFDVPGSSDGGLGTTVWQGSIFWAQGLAIWRFTPSGGVNVVDPIGLNLEDGLPHNRLGRITALSHTIDEMFALVAPETDSAQRPGVYSWNPQQGWQQFWTSSSNPKSASAVRNYTVGRSIFTGEQFGGPVNYHIVPAVSHLGGNARLGVPLIPGKQNWVGPNNVDSVWGVGWSTGIQDSATGTIAASTFEMITPWIVADGQQTWTALSATVAHSFPKTNSSVYGQSSVVLTDSERMSVQYGTDYNNSFTQLGTIKGKSDSNGESMFTIGGDEGLPFEAFRFKIKMNDSAAPTPQFTTTPDVNRLSLHLHKNLDPLWGFTVVIDAKSQGFGRSAKEVREELKALFDEKTLFTFSFKGDADQREAYRVAPVGIQSVEGTGTDQSGQFLLRLAEVN